MSIDTRRMQKLLYGKCAHQNIVLLLEEGPASFPHICLL